MPQHARTIQFFADRGDAGQRLDQVLVRHVTEISRMSRSVAQRWIESGVVAVDGRILDRPAARVRDHASIEVTLPPSATQRSTPAPEPGDVRVLYEDESLIAIDKPAGVVVHPSYKQLSGTLLNAVLWRIRDRPNLRPGILTRLDKDTSGVVIVALSPQVHATMQRDGAAGRISKEYLAIVCGTPKPRVGVIREPLGRDPADRRRVIVTPGGAASETRYEVIAVDDDAARGRLALVRCGLVTGRTHQIRVHLASRGWPILGDRLYGAADAAIARQALHAWRVTLPHPVTREPITLTAPLPADMADLKVGLYGKT